MDSQTTSSNECKQITIDVPQERVAEFYAFFGRFLAGGPGRGRGRGRHGADPGGGSGHRGRHCGAHREQSTPSSEAQSTTGPPGTTSV